MREAESTKTQLRREELLSVAWTLAARDGLKACTYRAIAAEAGTSPTPFVRQFPTREDLITALFDEVALRFEAARGEAVVTSDPLEALIAEGTELLSAKQTIRDCNRIVFDLAFHSLRDPKMRRRLRSRDREFFGRGVGQVEEAISRGEIRGDRPAAEIADQLGSLLLGLAFANLVYPNRLPNDHVQRLWEDGARRLVDPRVVPPVHQRVVAPGQPSVSTAPLARQDGRREELVEIAFRVTARDGLSGLSFRRLAEEAGTSTTPFTYGFGNRQRLLATMVRSAWGTSDQLKALASRIENPIDRFFAEWAEQLSDDPRQIDRERVYYELHHQALTSPELASLMREGDEHGFATSLPLIEQACEQGLARDCITAGDLLDQLFALFDGIGLRRLFLSEKRPAGYRVGLWEDGGRRLLVP